MRLLKMKVPPAPVTALRGGWLEAVRVTVTAARAGPLVPQRTEPVKWEKRTTVKVLLAALLAATESGGSEAMIWAVTGKVPVLVARTSISKKLSPSTQSGR